MTQLLELNHENTERKDKTFYYPNKNNVQKLTVNLDIPIPPDTVIISKVELEELEQLKLTGVYWTMKDLEKKVNRKSEWIKENILYPTKFRKVLDVDKGGFVFYPKGRGQTWSFQATKMAAFLEKNFNRFFSVNN
jgi:phage pi2 protein 07